MSNTEKIITKDVESKKELEITIPFSTIEIEMEEELKNLQKNYKMNGFRAGKVPVDMIRKNEGERLFLRTAEKVINNTLNAEIPEFIKNKNNKISVYGDYEIKKLEKGSNIEIAVKYDFVPEIPEIDYKNIELNRYIIDFKEKDTEKYINTALQHGANYVKQDQEYTSKMDDMVKISYYGTIDGVPFDGGKSDEYNLVLGSNSFIDTFEEQLVDKKTGDDVLVKVKFPDNYHQKALAGKNAEFQTKILEISTKINAELTDEFVKDNFSINSVQEYKDIIAKKTQEEQKELTEARLKNDLFDYLKNNIKFDIPERLIEQQQKYSKDKSIEDIKTDIRIYLLIDKVVKENKLEPTNEEITNEIMKKAIMLPGYEKKIIDLYKTQENLRNLLLNEIIENKFVNFVLTKVSTTDVHVTLEEFNK